MKIRMKYVGISLLVFTVLVNAFFFNEHMTIGNWFTNTPPSFQNSDIADQGLAEFVENMKLVVMYHGLELYHLKLFVTFMMDGVALALSFFFISHDSNR